MTPQEEKAMATIRDGVLGRKDAGLGFCRGRFYDHSSRSTCALGAIGIRDMRIGAATLSVDVESLYEFIGGWDARESDGPWWNFGREMASLAGLP